MRFGSCCQYLLREALAVDLLLGPTLRLKPSAKRGASVNRHRGICTRFNDGGKVGLFAGFNLLALALAIALAIALVLKRIVHRYRVTQYITWLFQPYVTGHGVPRPQLYLDLKGGRFGVTTGTSTTMVAQSKPTQNSNVKRTKSYTTYFLSCYCSVDISSLMRLATSI